MSGRFVCTQFDFVVISLKLSLKTESIGRGVKIFPKIPETEKIVTIQNFQRLPSRVEKFFSSSRNRSRSLSKTGTSSPNSDEPYYEIGDQTDSYSESELIVITVDGQDYKNETFDSGSKSQDSSDANSETLSDVSSGDEAQPPKRRKSLFPALSSQLDISI